MKSSKELKRGAAVSKMETVQLLKDKGKVSALEAKLKADEEFDHYRKLQDREYISDFDCEFKRIQGKQVR
jgi:hypothetical protein